MSADVELLDRLERVRILLDHAWQVRRAIAGGAGPERALERFLSENVEAGFVPRSDTVTAALAVIAERVEGRDDRLARLVRACDLTPLEADLVLCAVAPAVRRGFREALAVLGPEIGPGVHPAAHLLEVVCDGPVSYARGRAAVADGAGLLVAGVLEAHGPPPVAPLWRGLAASEVTRRWLTGAPSPYRSLDLEPPLRRLVAAPAAAALDRLAAAGPVRVALVGEPGAGRTRAAAHLAAASGRGALVATGALRFAVLDAQLRDRLLVVRDPDPDELAAVLDRPVSIAVITTPDAAVHRVLSMAGFARVELGPAPLPVQVAAWREALGDAGTDEDATAIARGYSLDLGAIEEAAARARVRAAAGLEPLRHAAERAARSHTSDRLAGIADRLPCTLTWEDLVLPAEVRAAVDEVWRAAAARETVFETWGFGARTPYGRAISALFSGEPGTGKTMVATLIARELGLELYRVDLSRVVDKYIGETEKHLAALFAEAERGRCALLFDEADALFGKRTQKGDSATERYANLEVNYLLQRIETFSGIAILTTNQESAMDDAFKRRIRYRVDFPFPEEDDREAMWRRLIPPGAPVADDVDPAELARRYRLSGGHIKSAVLRAAFAAAAADQAIDQTRLRHAVDQELEAIGKLVMR